MRTVLRLYLRSIRPRLEEGWSGSQLATLSVLILTVVGLAGCGAGTSTLPGNLPVSGGGGTFSITTTTLPDAVAKRAYTAAVVTDSSRVFLSFGQDSVGACNLSGGFPTGLTATPGFGTPTTPATLGTNDQCILQMTSAPAAGTFNFNVLITDAAVPPKTQSQPLTLTIRPEFNFLNSSGAKGAILFPDGVVGRSYGSAANAFGSAACNPGPGSCAPEQTNLSKTTPPPTTASGTAPNGNGPITVCAISDGSFGLATSPDSSKVQCLQSSAALPQTGVTSVTVSATDTPIMSSASTTTCVVNGLAAACPPYVPSYTAVPSGTVTTTTSNGGTALTLNVNPEITFSATSPSFQTAPNVFPDAVHGRTYGAPAKTSIVYTAQGGLMNAAIGPKGLIFNLSGGAFPATITCPKLTQTLTSTMNVMLTCDSGGAVMTAAAGVYNFGISVKDLGNTATPAKTITADTSNNTSYNIKVDAALMFSENLTSPLPVAVQNRAYGVGNTCAPGGTSACTPVVYTASNGLSGYVFTATTPYPGGFANSGNCTQGSGGASNTLTCNSPDVTATPATYMPTVKVDDTANATTPDAAALEPGGSSTQPAPITDTLNIIAPLSLTANADGAAPPNAVRGRAYGTGLGCIAGACNSLTYTAAGGTSAASGTSGYVFTLPPSVAAPAANGVPAGVTCTSSSTVATCNTPGAVLVTAATGMYPFTVSVTDTPNISTPAVAVVPAKSASVTVNSPLNLAPDPSSPDPPPPGVINRTYGNTAAGFKALVYDATGGLGGYSVGAVSGLPAPVACSFASPMETCTGGTAPITAAPGAYPFTMTLNDTADDATPSGSASGTTFSLNKSITINAVLALAVDANSIDPPPQAVQQRTYGNTAAGFKALIYDASGGLGTSGGGYVFGLPASIASPGTGVPALVACTNSNTAATCSSGTALVTAATGNYSFAVTLDDTANLTTPSGSQSGTTTTTGTKTINVAAALLWTANPAVDPPPSAVAGRDYGTGIGCSGGACTPLTYQVSGGTGAYTITGTAQPPGIACATSGGNLVTCESGTASGSVITPAVIPAATAAGTYPLSGSVTDAGNVSVPSGTLAITRNVTIDSPLSLPTNYGPTGATFPPGVTNRAYGTGAGCSAGNCTPIIYTPGGGLGSPYTFTNPATSLVPAPALPAGMACATTTTTDTCSASAISASSGTYTPTVTVDDVANRSTPDGTASLTAGSNTSTLVVDAVMTVTPPASVLPAVTGRRYGTGVGCSSVTCAPLQYKLNNGLGNYTLTGSSLKDGTDTFTCTLASPTFSCSDAAILVAGPSTPALTFTGAETGNAATPGGTATDSSKTLTVNAELTFSAISTPVTAVTGRPYGSASATCSVSPCTPQTYSVVNGLGIYNNPGSLVTTGGLTTFTCPLTGSTYSCSTTAVGDTGIQTLTFTMTDGGNASTPQKSFTDSSKTLTIRARLALNAPSPSPIPDAVTGRTYGAPLTDLTYTVSAGEGLPTVSIKASGFPTPISACNGPQTNAADSNVTLTCNSGGVGVSTGTSTGTVTASDTANASVPAATLVTDPNSKRADPLTVHPALAITNTLLPNGLLGFVYNPSGPGVTLTSTGGLPTTLTWIAPPTGATRACAAPTGTLDPDLSLNSATGVLSSSAALTTASASAGQYTFQVCVTDTANASTPAGFALPATTGNNYVIDVMKTLAYVAENAANKVAVISTTSNTKVASLSTNISAPDSVAVSPNGRQAYVTMGNNKIAVVDTITNLNFGNSPFSLPAGCSAPVGIAVTPDGTQFYVACPAGNEVLVFSAVTASTSATLTAAATVSMAASCTPDSVAFKPDGTRAYVTCSGNNKLSIINTTTPAEITGSPFTLDGTNITPLGIALATNTGKIYAYIAKNGAGTGNPGVEVEDVTADPTTSPLTPVTNIQTGSGSNPDSVAVLPDGSRVYATLSGANQFAVIDNTVATPVSITGSPFNLPDPAAASTASTPIGVTSPPLATVPATGYRVYLCLSNALQDNVAVMDDLGASPKPAKDSASPITIDTTAGPLGIAHIPIPK